ncbi:hypothetical protein TNIN_350531 [Trichonephila inaurata madagascariensis]|uniref:Uncharacterized protein n=1 Tax=Trichonephila inaurata madagascariensis TaxID=2747483 RepID=A0A8X6YSL6_9ARAC|nr:hypothetical protein TNIN_350531 [Trichonephila inaurata madagascariensis]
MFAALSFDYVGTELTLIGKPSATCPNLVQSRNCEGNRIGRRPCIYLNKKVRVWLYFFVSRGQWKREVYVIQSFAFCCPHRSKFRRTDRGWESGCLKCHMSPSTVGVYQSPSETERDAVSSEMNLGRMSFGTLWSRFFRVGLWTEFLRIEG